VIAFVAENTQYNESSVAWPNVCFAISLPSFAIATCAEGSNPSSTSRRARDINASIEAELKLACVIDFSQRQCASVTPVPEQF
jgi:hypothetical protein